MSNHLLPSSKCINQQTVHIWCGPSSDALEEKHIEEFLLSLMKDFNHIAWRYSERLEEREDLVSVAIVRIMEEIRLKNLLVEKSGRGGPRAYALVAGENEMKTYYAKGSADLLGRPTRKDLAAPVDHTPILSLDVPLRDEDSREVLDLAAPADPVWSNVSKKRADAVHQSLQYLTERERVTMLYLYGFVGSGKMTKNELAKELGLSVGGVSANATYARKKLRKDAELCAAVGVEVPA